MNRFIKALYKGQCVHGYMLHTFKGSKRGASIRPCELLANGELVYSEQRHWIKFNDYAELETYVGETVSNYETIEAVIVHILTACGVVLSNE